MQQSNNILLKMTLQAAETSGFVKEGYFVKEG